VIAAFDGLANLASRMRCLRCFFGCGFVVVGVVDGFALIAQPGFDLGDSGTSLGDAVVDARRRVVRAQVDIGGEC